MIDSEGSRSLRPLGIGELLDRAVTIAVRARVPLAIYVGISAFVAMFETAVGIDFVHLVRVFRNVPGAWQSGRLTVAGTTIFTGYNGWLAYATSIPYYLIGALTFGALIVYAAACAVGAPPAVGAAYGASGRRWTRLLCLQMLTWLPCTAIELIGLDLLALGAQLLVRTFGVSKTPTLAVVAAFASFAVVLAIVVVSFSLTFVAWYLAQCECLVGGRSIVASMRAALRSAFPRRAEDLRRAFVVGAMLGAIVVAAMVVGLFAQRAVVASTHVGMFGVLMQTTVMGLGLGVASVLATVHYVDLQVRREGIDLAVAARSLLEPA